MAAQNVNKKDSNNRFVQGFACACAKMMLMDGGVSTPTKELFDAGVGEYNLKRFRQIGIDEYDIEIFKKYRKDLK